MEKSSNKTASEIIQRLKLIPHPEGGFYRETYRSELFIEEGVFPEFRGGRHCSTSIYYMLTSESFSSFHRIRQDEIWHFYTGDPVLIHMLTDTGSLQTLRLGNDLKNGALPQQMVPANTWFAAELEPELGFSLVGCTVAPGFDFKDFEMGRRDDLIQEFPDQAELIGRLTRG